MGNSKAILLICSLLFFSLLLAGCTDKESADLNKEITNQVEHEMVRSIPVVGGMLAGDTPTPTIWAATPTPASTGECRFDSDCAPRCEGEVFWKRGCNAQTNTCENTFDYDCSAQQSSIGVFSFPKTCEASGCVDDTEAISEKKSELVQEANDYTADMQQTTSLRQIASKNCIAGLSDVTSKLIIDTAVSFGTLPTKMIDVLSDNTNRLVDQLADSGTKMSPEEYISLNCNAVKALDTDYALLSKKRDLVIAQAKPFEGH